MSIQFPRLLKTAFIFKISLNTEVLNTVNL